MSRITAFRSKILNQEPLSGTFLKTPSYILVEILAESGLDFLCLDAEHAPFDRAAIDQCLAVAHAKDFPLLVRTGSCEAKEILWALDCGAVGVVLPHVESVEIAQNAAKSARFGLGGRGYAGSSRWAGYATNSMKDLLQKSQTETVVIAQIEEPHAVPLAEAIAAIDGIDALFAGPADLSVGMGKINQNSDELKEALQQIGLAAKAHKKGYASFIAKPENAINWQQDYGVHMFFAASEHTWMRNGAKAVAQAVQKLRS